MMMNLTTDPWIPALRSNGRRELFSLQDLFGYAHELCDLVVKPHERIALMRLLLCVTQATLDGPVDEDDWSKCEPNIQPRVRDYLEKWKGAFRLLEDGGGFLQLTNLEPGKKTDDGTAATKLDLTLATGGNTTLFDNLAGDSGHFNWPDPPATFSPSSASPPAGPSALRGGMARKQLEGDTVATLPAPLRA